MFKVDNNPIKFVIVFIAILFLQSCTDKGLVGDGVVVTEDRPITEFVGLRIMGDYNVVITQGNTFSVSLKTDDNLLDNTVMEIRSDVLVIDSQKKVLKSTENTIIITVKDIEVIKLHENVNLKLEHYTSRKPLTIFCKDKSNIDLDVSLMSLKVNTSGYNTVKLKGNTSLLTVDVSGSGDLDAFEMSSKDVYLTITGVVNSRVHAIDYLKVKSEGTGVIEYKGNPSLVKDISGVTAVKHIDGNKY